MRDTPADAKTQREDGSVSDPTNQSPLSADFRQPAGDDDTRENRTEFEESLRKAELAAKERSDAQALAARLDGVTVTIARAVGEEDKMFGSVTSRDIDEALRGQGVQVDRRKIVLRDPLKALGQVEVPVKLHADVMATVKVNVVKQ